MARPRLVVIVYENGCAAVLEGELLEKWVAVLEEALRFYQTHYRVPEELAEPFYYLDEAAHCRG